MLGRRRTRSLRRPAPAPRPLRPAPRAPTAPRERPSAYYEIAGVRIDAEVERLRGLPIFGAGRLAAEAPQVKVRRASRRPNRVGFAIPDEWRISVTAYPGIRAGDVLEVVLHELVHLHVGAQPGHRRWHGRLFTETLRAAMGEAYGVHGVRTPPGRHGAYAEAIERARERAARAGAAPDQLGLFDERAA